ncbi:outer membrane lipoprotein carrier protein [Allopseudospirillum japonicum]|uniref:Outer-membrane lipoprotein carrier protein n=1 Tax=Allopseudospirillum japonicum TaxID=64971 RepID=A0A1H6RM87_9GAMM|nr:outer membrane lipoprotein chaperone LolA [Allopseudospirillum japonicum]SEI56863.1 outer membrane lipoprotein carrier protein [Allopseudospirillum japonicum]
MIRLKALCQVTAGLLFMLLSTLGSLQAANRDAQALHQHLTKMHALSAHFTQQILNARGTQIQQVSGYLALERPHYFYWQTLAPFPQEIVSNGQQLWVYDPDLEQVSLHTLDEQAHKTPIAVLLGNFEQLSRHYQVSQLGGTAKAVQMFQLVPLTETNLFTHLQVRFVDGVLDQLTFADTLGQQTRIDLDRVHLNPELDPSQFEFQIPENTEVIRALQAESPPQPQSLTTE